MLKTTETTWEMASREVDGESMGSCISVIDVIVSRYPATICFPTIRSLPWANSQRQVIPSLGVSTSSPIPLLQSSPVCLQFHIPIFSHHLTNVPLSCLTSCRPLDILLILLLALFPLLYLLVREACFSKSLRSLLLPALLISERLYAIVPIIFIIRVRQHICSRVISRREARLYAHGIGFAGSTTTWPHGRLVWSWKRTDDCFERI